MVEAGDPLAQRVYANQGNAALLALLPTRVGRALDCGCGAGDNARLLRERGWSVVGLTLSRAEQHAASAWCERVEVADLEQPLPLSVGSGFDLVLLSHVLEHLADPATLLRSLKAVLAPGGLIAVALPNPLFYPYRLRALRGHFDYETSGIMDETHLRFYTFLSGAELLRRHGYRVLLQQGEGAFPLWKLRGLFPAALTRWIDACAVGWFPGLFGRQSLYLARAEAAPQTAGAR